MSVVTKFRAWALSLGTLRVREYQDGNGKLYYRIECRGVCGWYTTCEYGGSLSNAYASKFETDCEKKAHDQIAIIINRRLEPKRIPTDD